MTRTLSLFETERLSLDRALALSIESLQVYGSLYKHWAIAFSGDKDSSATVTLVARIGCPLVTRDAALDRWVARAEYAYLRPLQQLRDLYWEVHKSKYRHRKVIEYNVDGRLTKNQNRLGPLTLEAREWILGDVLLPKIYSAGWVQPLLFEEA